MLPVLPNSDIPREYVCGESNLLVHYKGVMAGHKLKQKDGLALDKTEIKVANLWVNGLPAEYIKGFRSSPMPVPESMHWQLENEVLEMADREFIPLFERKKIEISSSEISDHLWVNSGTSDPALVPDSVVQKVNAIADYLKREGFELRGVKKDSNSFCNAFLKSYKMLSQKIYSIDHQGNKISYLRNLIASQFPLYSQTKEKPKLSAEEIVRRTKKIKKDKNELKAGEGKLLAKALRVPIRIISNKNTIVDTLTLEDGSRQDLKPVNQQPRPQEYVFLVDLGGHFICAQRFRCKQVCGEILQDVDRWSWLKVKGGDSRARKSRLKLNIH